MRKVQIYKNISSIYRLEITAYYALQTSGAGSIIAKRLTNLKKMI